MPRTRKTSTKTKTPKTTATEKDAVVSETAPSETDTPNSAETLKESPAPAAQEAQGAQDKGTTAEEPAGQTADAAKPAPKTRGRKPGTKSAAKTTGKSTAKSTRSKNTKTAAKKTTKRAVKKAAAETTTETAPATSAKKKVHGEPFFALDIGTRSIIGIVAEKLENEQMRILATVRREHKTRAMLDGQIHDVPQVADLIREVKHELEKTTGTLKSASVAAAGRALYQASRRKRSTPNDSDRLRKYLRRFGLEWADVAE